MSESVCPFWPRIWTSNSGDPFNQPSKSCTKWLLVMYNPGGGGGGGSTTVPPPQSSRHVCRAGRVEKSVSIGTSASTGVAGGTLGSSSCFRPSTSNATGASSSLSAV